MISVRNISFLYTNGFNLFEDINFDVGVGEIVGFYGPSGIGKTTLLKILGGLLQPQSGEIFVEGKNIFDMNYVDIAKYRNETLGFIFQNFNLLDDFSAYDNIMLPYTIGGAEKSFDNKWFDFLINFFEVKKFLSKGVNQISGGEKQRISIIKSLIHKPKILLMDEPTTYLNVELSNKFYDLVANYSKDNICIFVSHDDYAKQYFDLKLSAEYGDIKIYKNKSS